MKRRQGVMMVELVVVMSACTILLTLTGVLLQRAMKIQSQSRSHANVERTSLRLANQFRKDVHAARAATVTDADQKDGVFLRLEFEGGYVAEYSRSADGIERIETAPSRPVWRENYKFALEKLTVEEERKPQRLILTAIAGPEGRLVEGGKFTVPAIPVSLRAEAVVSRSLRYSQSAAGQEVAE